MPETMTVTITASRRLGRRGAGLVGLLGLAALGAGLAGFQYVSLPVFPETARAASVVSPVGPAVDELYVAGVPWQLAQARDRAQTAGADANSLQDYPRHPEP